LNAVTPQNGGEFQLGNELRNNLKRG